MHLVVEEGSDSGGPQPQRFGGEIQAMADGARFEMRVAIASVAVSAGGAIEIGNHGKRHAGISSKILPETEACRGDTLVT